MPCKDIFFNYKKLSTKQANVVLKSTIKTVINGKKIMDFYEIQIS